MSWGTVLKAAEIVLGLTLLYLRFCLYETEEGRLQNALVALWVRVSAYADTTRERLGRLLRETAQITTRFLDAIFGLRPISLRSISVSFLLIGASADFSMYGAFLAGSHITDFIPRSMAWWPLTQGMLFLVAALAPVLIPRRWAIWIPVATFFLYLISSPVIVFTSGLSLSKFGGYEPLINGLVSLIVALIIDFLWLIAVRLATKWASRHRGIWPHAVVILTSATITVGSFILFAFTMRFLEWSKRVGLPVFIVAMMISVSSTRLFVSAISVIQLMVLIIAFAHWIIWPVLSRVVYAAERYQLFRERKWFGYIGFALIGHATAGTWVADVMGTPWPKK